MKLNTLNFGLSVATVVACLWSFYSLGNFCLDIVIITLHNGSIYSNLSNLNLVEYATNYLVQVMGITFVTGILGWLVAEIYNDLEDIFSLKLK